MPLSPRDRYARYLAAIGPAVQGSGGDQRTYEAIRAAWGFALDEGDAMAELEVWNRGCSPPWSHRDLRSKLSSIYRRCRLPRGYMLDEDVEPTPPREPKYPDDAESFVARCTDGSKSTAILEWVQARGIAAEEFVASHMGIMFRERQSPPTWAAGPAGYELIVPIFDAAGICRGSRIRWCATEDDPIAGMLETPAPNGAKTRAMTGFDSAGLVMLNVAGWSLLAQRLLPTRIWVVEGEPDMLTLSVALMTAGRRSDAVIGLFSGAWTWALAKAIPAGSEVILATHEDLQGRKYAEEVQESLHGRATIKRHAPRGRSERHGA